jgi:hypothetical protein
VEIEKRPIHTSWNIFLKEKDEKIKMVANFPSGFSAHCQSLTDSWFL